MDTRILIDAIVRQTTVLIAQLSTAAGIRAPLSHVADQIFVDLARQIESQGVSRKVAADMFGIALRTYQKKVDRLTESVAQRGRTLWQAVLDHAQSKPGVTREDVLRRFASDGEANVIAVLHDLVGSGVLQSTGRGLTAAYHPTSPEERSLRERGDRAEALEHMAWLEIYYRGPLAPHELARLLCVPEDEMASTLEHLAADGRIEASAVDGRVSAKSLYIPVGTRRGWEAAVFDHYQAVVTSICRKLNRGVGTFPSDDMGGGTLTFELCSGHPYEADVLGLLAKTRSELNALWQRIEDYNRVHPVPEESRRRFTFYYGQSHDGGERHFGGVDK